MRPLYSIKEVEPGRYVIDRSWRRPPRYMLETAIVCFVAIAAFVVWLIWPM